MLRSYKFRLYPNKEVQRKLEKQLEICRWLYNKLLEEINKARKENRKVTERYTSIDSQVKRRKSKIEKSQLQSSSNGELSVMELSKYHWGKTNFN